VTDIEENVSGAKSMIGLTPFIEVAMTILVKTDEAPKLWNEDQITEDTNRLGPMSIFLKVSCWLFLEMDSC